MTPVHYAAMNDHADVVELFYKLAPETLAKDTPVRFESVLVP